MRNRKGETESMYRGIGAKVVRHDSSWVGEKDLWRAQRGCCMVWVVLRRVEGDGTLPRGDVVP